MSMRKPACAVALDALLVVFEGSSCVWSLLMSSAGGEAPPRNGSVSFIPSSALEVWEHELYVSQRKLLLLQSGVLRVWEAVSFIPSGALKVWEPRSGGAGVS